MNIKMALFSSLLILTLLGYAGTRLYNIGKAQAELECTQNKLASAARLISEANQINAENEKIADEYWKDKLAKQPKILEIETRIVEYVETDKNSDCRIDDVELHILTDLVNLANGNAENHN